MQFIAVHQDAALLIYTKDNIFCYKIFHHITNRYIALQIYDNILSKNYTNAVKDNIE